MLEYKREDHDALAAQVIQAQAGLQRDLLILLAGQARLALLQGRHPRGIGQGLRGVIVSHRVFSDILLGILQ